MDINAMQNLLQTRLKPTRFEHCLGVMDYAVKLAQHFGENEEKARIAGLIHDCAREYGNEQIIIEAEKRGIKLLDIERRLPSLIHAPLGKFIAQEKYGITDMEILNAIAHHTVGGHNMSRMDKIIYLADMIEMHRRFPGVEELRRLAFTVELDEVMLRAFDHSLKFIISREDVIHPDTIVARNEIILKRDKL